MKGSKMRYSTYWLFFSLHTNRIQWREHTLNKRHSVTTTNVLHHLPVHSARKLRYFRCRLSAKSHRRHVGRWQRIVSRCCCVHHWCCENDDCKETHIYIVADDCCLVADAREQWLCSTDSRTCVVTQPHSTFGDRAFAAAGPGYGTVYRHISEMQTYRTVGSGGH